MIVTYEFDRDEEYISADFSELTADWVVDKPGMYSRDELTFQELLDELNKLPSKPWPTEIIIADLEAAIYKKEEHNV